MHITQGIMSGEGYSKIAKALRDDLGMAKAQSVRVARTETGRALSQAGLDSAMVAKDNGINMKNVGMLLKIHAHVIHTDT